MKVLFLRFDAPLQSFGGVKVDQRNVTDDFPYRSMLVGLLGNALGWTRTDVANFTALQGRLLYAARRDREGQRLVDYQTVDLGARGPLADGLGWTTHGELEARKGGDAADGTHIRYRHYLADAVYTVALSLSGQGDVSVDDLAAGVKVPKRPLFLGRKCCVPSGRVFLALGEHESLRRSLAEAPLHGRADKSADQTYSAVWPASAGYSVGVDEVLWGRVEDRDFSNEIHVGRSFYVRGRVRVEAS